MDCEKVRDQFSSLSEGELKPEEEKNVREHLASCPDCQKEWEAFNRMMGWLHSVEEEEVPEGFLAGIEKKLEEQKGKERQERGWSLRTVKIPLQAAAMVLIVIFALYLTKMGPFEMLQKRPIEKAETLQQDQEKKRIPLKEGEQEVAPAPPGVDRKDTPSETRRSIEEEKVGEKDRMVHKMKEENKELTVPSKKEMVPSEPIFKKEVAKAESPILGKKEADVKQPAEATLPFAKKPVQEITLKTTDQERAFLYFQEVVKQFGGEVVREKGDVFVATLPASAFAAFEKEVRQTSLSPISPPITLQKEMREDSTLASEAKGQEVAKRKKESLRLGSPKEEMISIRIHLVIE